MSTGTGTNNNASKTSNMKRIIINTGAKGYSYIISRTPTPRPLLQKLVTPPGPGSSTTESNSVRVSVPATAKLTKKVQGCFQGREESAEQQYQRVHALNDVVLTVTVSENGPRLIDRTITDARPVKKLLETKTEEKDVEIPATQLMQQNLPPWVTFRNQSDGQEKKEHNIEEAGVYQWDANKKMWTLLPDQPPDTDSKAKESFDGFWNSDHSAGNGTEFETAGVNRLKNSMMRKAEPTMRLEYLAERKCQCCGTRFSLRNVLQPKHCECIVCHLCVIEVVRNSTGEYSFVRCPCVEEYTNRLCSSPITALEIKKIVSEDLFREYCQFKKIDGQTAKKTISSRKKNIFECKTKNCWGFTHIVPGMPGNDVFRCPACNKENCLVCKSIHHPDFGCLALPPVEINNGAQQRKKNIDVPSEKSENGSGQSGAKRSKICRK